ncbi:MAG TPA: hypothetical protein VN947_04080 [Polyangia bacterium]|nr:hypothetical protein [Polyangia bacterium]
MSPTSRAALVLAAAAAGCTTPSYGNGHLQCAAGGACPGGFYCASDDHCWRAGSGPADADLAIPVGDDLASPLLLDLAGADLATPASTCASLSGSVLFCDGFESDFATNGWSVSGSNGTPSLDTTRAYRGLSALHSHISGAPAMAGPVALLHRADLFPISGTIYARVWVYFTSGLPDSFEQLLNFADNVSTGYSVATDTGKVTLNDYAAGVYQRSTTAIPLDRWACLQFEVEQSSASGAIHIRVDGNLLADLPQNAMTTAAVNLSVGLDFYGNAVDIPAYDAWFDELLIDNKPTTCEE